MCAVTCVYLLSQGMYGNAIRLNDGSGTGYARYLDQAEEVCFTNNDDCLTGFTLMVWLKMADLYDGDTHHYISTDRLESAETGVSLLSDQGILQAYVRAQQQAWGPLTVYLPLLECKIILTLQLIPCPYFIGS